MEDWEQHIDNAEAPVIRGKGIAARDLLTLLARGWTRQRLLERHPELSVDDLNALFAYSASILPPTPAPKTTNPVSSVIAAVEQFRAKHSPRLTDDEIRRSIDEGR